MGTKKFIQGNKKQVFAFFNKAGQAYDFIKAEFADSNEVQLCSKSFANWAQNKSQTHGLKLFAAELIRVK